MRIIPDYTIEVFIPTFLPLRPWRLCVKLLFARKDRRSWCIISTDPQFAAKAADIIGLYLNPPEKASHLFFENVFQTAAQLNRLEIDSIVDEVALLRGVVFSKRGRIFKERSIQDYLEKQAWYKRRTKISPMPF